MANVAEAEIDDILPVEEQLGEPSTLKPSSDQKTGAGASAVRSIEGWIVLVTNIHEEPSDEDLQDLFGEYGEIQNLHLNLDRRTGYVKGYALIEYSTLAEAREAIAQTNNTKLLDQTIYTDFAFVRPLLNSNANRGGGAGGGHGRRGGRSREASKPPGAPGDIADEALSPISPSPENVTAGDLHAILGGTVEEEASSSADPSSANITAGDLHAILGGLRL